ncbi:MAG: hypothetical protein DSZ03_03900 [Sulfurimonas sp.]|nr:MAG: hypothetical protein DSZ03_03900 [Sulfurimonas sp.]
MNLPENAQKIDVAGASVDFYTYKEGDTTIFQFDSSMTGPPEPMVNAMAGLKLLDSSDKKLVMINHKAPGGLFSKIGENFSYVVQNLDDGNVKVVVRYIAGARDQADLSDSSCH